MKKDNKKNKALASFKKWYSKNKDELLLKMKAD